MKLAGSLGPKSSGYLVQFNVTDLFSSGSLSFQKERQIDRHGTPLVGSFGRPQHPRLPNPLGFLNMSIGKNTELDRSVPLSHG